MIRIYLALTFVILAQAGCFNGDAEETVDHSKAVSHSNDEDRFLVADKRDWELVFEDDFSSDWDVQWALDGKVGTVVNTPEGLVVSGGPEFGNDAHHLVLWTKDQFEGDLKIDYTYTRLDDETRAVTILYIQASGSGEGPYNRDIFQWSELREIPAMRTYYDNMETYHISYAAFPNDADETGYIRARRYVPHATGLKGTGLEPDYFPKGLFEKGVPHRITVIKTERDLYMRIRNAQQTLYCHMQNPDLAPILRGRIGLRHMYTRSARYADFSVSRPMPVQD